MPTVAPMPTGSRRALWFALAIWVVAVFIGTAGRFAPREAFPMTGGGQSIVQCSDVFVGSERIEYEQGDWCTDGNVIGAVLPDDVTFSTGGVVLDWSSFRDQLIETLYQPDFWLAAGLGTAALVTIFAFASITGALRTGLAAGITVVFFGLLLMPGFFTFQVPADLRSELVDAWKLIIVFYFGTEGAVQAWKVVHPEGRNVGGDATPSGEEPTSTAASTSGTVQSATAEAADPSVTS
jgi:hypothetical protein